MPQFDVSFYLSQAFWMLISFGFLYLMMSHLICPMIDEVLAERARLIQSDLDAAERINRQAEKLIQRHQAFVAAAEQEKAVRIQNAYTRIQKEASVAEDKNERALRRKVRSVEAKITAADTALRQQSELISSQIADELSDHFFKRGKVS